MKRTVAVIGAGYGDEGKGLMTDYFAHHMRSLDPLVIRGNGGPQAAHTVQLPSGERHVFKHFGSGVLAGADTYLSRFFVVNPIAFSEEKKELLKLGYDPAEENILVSTECLVTHPIDMALGQMAEIARGSSRHGSCGWGINETLRRNANPSYGLKFGEACEWSEEPHQRDFLDRLGWIREYYVPIRMRELGLEEIPDHLKPILLDDVPNKHFVEMMVQMRDSVTQVEEESLLGEWPVIFEGAQGLGLDQTRGHFPYVTPSNTGLANVKALAAKMETEEIEVVYVTRCYATRHGAGPLENEGLSPGISLNDPTNVENQWQGELRLAPLDVDLLCDRIYQDYRIHSSVEGYYPKVSTKLSLAITCLDQVGEDGLQVVVGKALKRVTEEELWELISHRLPINGNRYTSHGPTRDNVRCLDTCTATSNAAQYTMAE